MAALTQQEQVLGLFSNIDDPEVACKFLHAYLAPGALKIPFELCTRILSKDPAVHETVKEAHRLQNVEALDKICVYIQRNAWRFQPHLEDMNQLLMGISSNGKINLVANGEWRRPFWTPPKSLSDDSHAESETTAYIESLHIPLGNPNKEIPLIILHELGSFQYNVKLRNRLDRIFSPSSHTFLVNTSGEWDDFRWCSDTGSFNDPEDHRRYVSQFMPVTFASSVTGQALIDRMWYWLRGRHRYTASFLAVLLHSNFTSPHTLLEAKSLATIIGIHRLVPRVFLNGHLAQPK
ncbi:hypothetical protein LENED_010194 [Lentinula edodes]|uniref:Uncharacterized protein n=1 Tax=Lentinula edodes TaxID=5353 RepID=A0A1Q3ELQ6_LENED|nr:hypothetical protein LENED_010194 [Lentinula edodes]